MTPLVEPTNPRLQRQLRGDPLAGALLELIGQLEHSYCPGAEYLPAGHATQRPPSETYPLGQQRPKVQSGKKAISVE
jgi:hypothetical protein